MGYILYIHNIIDSPGSIDIIFDDQNKFFIENTKE